VQRCNGSAPYWNAKHFVKFLCYVGVCSDRFLNVPHHTEVSAGTSGKDISRPTCVVRDAEKHPFPHEIITVWNESESQQF
jgi:hypothetical protein